MLLKQKGEYQDGYSPIVELDGIEKDMLLDFGILKLKAGESYRNKDSKERAYMIMTGRINLTTDDTSCEFTRENYFTELPEALQICSGKDVVIKALEDSEIAVEAALNDKVFPDKVYRKEDCRADVFGKTGMGGCAERTVRTIFDAANAPWSEMVLGEVINHPGKWSSYPPHDHPQPEIYHFRFNPPQGFGFSGHEDEVFKIESGDTVSLYPGKVHPQCSAPGYAMYYIWMIPHLPGERFGPDSRVFRKEHLWLLEES